MPSFNYDLTQNSGFMQAYEQTTPQQNSNTAQQTNVLPVSGKKVVALGGNSEQAVGTVDLQYKTIYNDLFRFRKLSKTDTSSSNSGDVADQMFYALDQPGHYYFKIFFYFSNPYSDPSNPLSSNLLGLKYLDEKSDKQIEEVNTALNYLHNNMEYTRFNRLAEFIQLLSDISTKSPWYFQSVSGLDQAIERPEVSDKSFLLEDERKTITIKCLPDAYDNRIGRLLDLYRSVVYSQNLHKWILPANLRKFDMGIYIFNSPIKTIAGGRHGISDNISERVLETKFKEYYGDEEEDSCEESANQSYTKLAGDLTITGSKYIELRGCEIDYNSSKSAYSELDNAEGKPMEYEIIIRYDSAAEDRYDPIFRSYIGDFVVEDLLNGSYEVENQGEPYAGISSSKSPYINGVVGDPFGANNQITLLDSAIGMGIGYLNTLVGKVMLGNIYGFSFSKLESIVSADPMSALISAGREVNNAKLIAKRISDFTDPGKGTRELSGKRLYETQEYSGQPLIGHGEPKGPLAGKNFRDQETDHQDEEWNLSDKSLRSTDIDHTDEEWDLSGKSLRSTDTDHTDEEWNLTDKNLRSPDTDHQDEDADLSEKNMYRGWEVTPANNDLSGKSFSRPDTDHQNIDWDLNGRTFRRENDHIDEEWDLSDMNFYRS